MIRLPDVAGKPVIKQETIDELMPRESDGAPLLNRLFEIYLEETPRLLGELERKLEEKDAQGVYDVIHQMKGSAAAMGAARVFTLTQAALEICREGDGRQILGVPNLVACLEKETDLYVRDLSEMLSVED